jgi:hypothetical protein
MTLNTTGPISLGGSTAGQSINLELGKSATATVSLNDTDVRTLAGVASGAIIVPTNFYGKSAVIISITDQTAADFSAGLRTARAGYRLTSTGLAQIMANNVYATVETWCTPTSQAGFYEAFVDVLSGGLDSGTVGSWVNLGVTQTWQLAASIGNNNLCVFDISIRRGGTTTILDTATITVEADAQF